MAFDPRHFSAAFDLSEFVPVVPSVVPSGLPPMMRPPLPELVSFTKRLIVFGRIRRPIIQEGYLIGKIRRFFADGVVFTATSIKIIDEVVTLEGAILTDDVPDRALLALFEAHAKEQDTITEE